MMPSIRSPSFMDEHGGGGQVLVLTVTYIFSGRVNENVVSSAVSKLSATWPELAAEMQLVNDKGKRRLELTIPEGEDAQIDFTIKEFAQSIDTVHKPVTGTEEISIPSLPELTTFLGTPDYGTLGAFLKAGLSKPFRLQLSLFEDASLFSVYYPHVRMDVGAHQEVMKALIRLINDLDTNMESPLSNDVFEKLMDHVPEGKSFARPTTAWQVATREALGPYLEADKRDVETDGKIDTRRLYFPKGQVDTMRMECIEELVKGGDRKTATAFLSEGDVIGAWMLKNLASSPANEPDRRVRFQYIVDTRFRLPSLFKNNGPYLSNACLILTPELNITQGQLAFISLAEVARSIREGIDEQTQSQKIEEHVLWTGQQASGGVMQIPWSPGDRTFFVSNWLRHDLASLQLARNILTVEGTGKVIDIDCNIPVMPRNGAELIYKDAAGGTVAYCSLGRNQWNSLSERLGRRRQTSLVK